MIALSLYYGFTSTGVDNWCHVGGLISGFFLSLLLYRRKELILFRKIYILLIYD